MGTMNIQHGRILMLARSPAVELYQHTDRVPSGRALLLVLVSLVVLAESTKLSSKEIYQESQEKRTKLYHIMTLIRYDDTGKNSMWQNLSYPVHAARRILIRDDNAESLNCKHRCQVVPHVRDNEKVKSYILGILCSEGNRITELEIHFSFNC